jgi:formiminotetrahydrofolate cyclodeaminase
MDFMKQRCEDFVTVLASKEPVPGGGGAAAFAAAIGTALGNMVGSLTLGKKKYADVQEDIIALKAKADALQADFLALVAKDAEAFEPLSKAYGIPKDDPKREETMEAALKKACAVPFEIMRKCCEAIDLHEEFAAKGTRIAISDVGCGVALCKAALLAASLNVFINTKLMKDRAHAERINADAEYMLDAYAKKADRVYESVLAILR